MEWVDESAHHDQDSPTLQHPTSPFCLAEGPTAPCQNPERQPIFRFPSRQKGSRYRTLSKILASVIAPRFRRLRSLVPFGMSGSRVFWFWHLAMTIVCLRYLYKAKPPEKMRFTRQAAEGLKHNLSDCVEMGLWQGALFHLLVSVLLLVTVRWWGRPVVATLETRLPALALRTRWFVALLAVLLVTAAAIRLPRLNLSYWGDEGWALSAYVHGNYKPAEGSDWQGPLSYKPATWQATFWNDQNGGNHYFFSVLQRLTLSCWRSLKGLPDTAFDESISRLPPFAAGLASIALAALLLRWLGRPRAGLWLALLLALHPWHIRYSTEARGYALMLCLFLAFLWFLLLAAREGRWRWWLGVAVTAFLCVWSWKLAAVSVVAANAVVLIHLLSGPRGERPSKPPLNARLTAAARLLVANLTGGAFCVALVMPAVLQSPEVTARFQRMGKPMDLQWLETSLSGVLIGVPWRRASVGNPVEAPLTEALAHYPFTTTLGVYGVLALMLLGLVALWRQRPLHSQLCAALFLASGLGAALFKWRLGVEWIYWYFYPLILPATVLFAAGIEACTARLTQRTTATPAPSTKRLPRWPLAALIPAAWIVTISPFSWINLHHPYEAQRECFLATRGQHEPWHSDGPHAGPSQVITCHLWRHIDLYDPRALLSVRDVPAPSNSKCSALTRSMASSTSSSA